MTNNDRLLWETIYRCLMSIAAAIKRFKLSGCHEPVERDTIGATIEPGNRG